MKHRIASVFAALIQLSFVASVIAAPMADQDWKQWRGPTANGMAAENANPPVEWSATKNVAWKTKISGLGNSTPIIVDGKVFVTSAAKTDVAADEPIEKHPESLTEPSDHLIDFNITCLDLETGDVIWEKTAKRALPHEGHHPSHTYAGASPVSDGTRLYVSFGSFGIFCFDFDGNQVWETSLGAMRTRRGWGEATSPAVHDGRLVMPWDQEDQSRIFVLDAATGEISWEDNRNEPTTWATPLIVNANDRVQVITNGTTNVRSYDLRSGEIVWQTAGTTLNAIPSPVRFGDHVICMAGYRGNAAHSIPLNGNGTITESELEWSLMRDTPYVPSPVLSGNRLYFTKSNRAILSCINAETGESIFGPVRLPGLENLYASPVGAAGKIYISSREGTTIVLKDGDDFEVLATNRLDDPIDASPVIVGDRLLLRAKSALYCIQQ